MMTVMKVMYRNWSVNRFRIYLLPVILILVWITIPQCLKGQDYNGKNVVYIIGQVTNDENGGPVKYQEVFILSDTIYEPQSYYYKKILTDHEGYYYDTINTKFEKGAFNISTIDYLNNQHDTTVYYRFTWGADNYLFPNFIIPIKPLPVFYQANFYYIRNPGGQNELEYQFNDLTNAENISSWLWEFGDGVISIQQNPQHVFETPGLYRVKLTVEIENTPGNLPFVTQIVKVVNVTVKDYFHFGGHVFAGYFPIDHGNAFLYKIEETKLMPIDTAYFNSQLGHYVFYQLIEGDYIVKADLTPVSVLFDQYMTTYYSDKLHWDQADTIFHHKTSFSYHINLVPNNMVMNGPGNVSGMISWASLEKGNIPARYMSIFLYDLEENPVAFCHSDNEGLFDLSGLDLGSYLLYAEVTGKNTIPLLITLDEFNTHITQVELIIDLDEVFGSFEYAGLENQTLFRGVSQPYPNPAAEKISIDLLLSERTSLVWSLIDNSGRLVSTRAFQGEPGENSINMDVSVLAPGLYFIGIHSNDGRVVTRKFIR
jgi:hypothetical protein